ncbi:MAG TPA: serine hydrolase [Candidatus Sulfomarinibacteraceae bacterium]|nr:serine hydrolase [Candidatus Sulfomarinibacteraceae bacterium]
MKGASTSRSRGKRPQQLLLVAGLALLLSLAACQQRLPGAQAGPSDAPATPAVAATAPPTTNTTATPPPETPDTPTPATTGATPTPTGAPQQPSPTLPAPTYAGPYAMAEAHCGVHLPVLAMAPDATQDPLPAPSLAAFPEEVRPALAHLFEHPQQVALAAYEVGREDEGIYLNADTPVPLASVVKVIHLVAYAQAVQNGVLNEEAPVPLSEMERYFLPGSDLGAHSAGLNMLREEERVLDEPPAILLQDVPRLMVEYSSNAATDYVHMLLGQEHIEQTAVDLGLAQQTAPCPFLGQFLLMGRNGADVSQVETLLQEPEVYSRDVVQLTERFSTDPAFRQETRIWRDRSTRPSLQAQALFSNQLSTRGSARAYAALMARIATNDLGPWEQNVRIRRYLEWPTHIPVNQEKLAWLGYKGGSLPGVLTVVYYAQPWDRAHPVVVALFFHDLPLDTYRQWRRSLPHDELARWLLREREAIPTLRALLDQDV